jgi:hypothetical protein
MGLKGEGCWQEKLAAEVGNLGFDRTHGRTDGRTDSRGSEI